MRTDPLRYCILLSDFSAVQSDQEGWQIYTDAETLQNACQISAGIPSTVEAAEHIVKQNADLDALRDQLVALHTQLERTVQHGNIIGNKQAQIIKERDDALKHVEQLKKAMQFAFEQLHHSYNDAPDWLEHDTHGWIRQAAIGLRDALAR